MFRIAVITASDKGSQGLREDISGKVIMETCKDFGKVVSYEVLPDERDLLSNRLRILCDEDIADIVFTTGGTGFSQRDVTPEATMDVVERPTPGIPEAMRLKSLQITDRAMLSRAAAGIRKGTLIVNLPGSPKAVKECLEAVLPALSHGLMILRGSASECAR